MTKDKYSFISSVQMLRSAVHLRMIAHSNEPNDEDMIRYSELSVVLDLIDRHLGDYVGSQNGKTKTDSVD